MKAKDVLKLSMLAGEIMLKSGAEVYRVEDTMKRMLLHFDYEIAESFVTMTAILATIEDENEGMISMVKRVVARTNNLEKIALVNQFSRDLADNKIDLNDAFNILDGINKKPTYNLLTMMIAGAFTGFGFVIMLGGGILEGIITIIIGLIVHYVKEKFTKKKVSNMITDMICGALISLIALLFVNFGVSDNYDVIIISSMMPYVPGLLLTNGIRDIFAEDFLSGGARLLNAVLVSASLATGVGTVLKVWMIIFGGVII